MYGLVHFNAANDPDNTKESRTQQARRKWCLDVTDRAYREPISRGEGTSGAPAEGGQGLCGHGRGVLSLGPRMLQGFFWSHTLIRVPLQACLHTIPKSK